LASDKLVQAPKVGEERMPEPQRLMRARNRRIQRQHQLHCCCHPLR